MIGHVRDSQGLAIFASNRQELLEACPESAAVITDQIASSAANEPCWLYHHKDIWLPIAAGWAMPTTGILFGETAESHPPDWWMEQTEFYGNAKEA